LQNAAISPILIIREANPMRKILFTLAVFGMIMGMSCDNDNVNETNPYTDGVYPFEVSDVVHTQKNYIDYTFTWVTPADKGFAYVQIEMFVLIGENWGLAYSSIPNVDILWGWENFVLDKNSFSFHTIASNDQYVLIKCVDKFGNISEGVRYDFSYVNDY
jgi:hypothetical protein